jgi:hypothetical protein
MLKREIAEDERKGWADKRTSQQERMLQLDAQMREKVLPAVTLHLLLSRRGVMSLQCSPAVERTWHT